MSNSDLIRQMLKPKKQWVKDSDVKYCFECKKQFLPIVRWRHHCRFCGNVFCSKCVQNIIFGEQIDYKEEKRLRHCQKCQQKIKRILTQEVLQYQHKSQMYDINQHQFKFEVEDLTEPNTFEEEQNISKYKVYVDRINQQLDQQIFNISKMICQRYLLDIETWAKRLGELAMKTVNEVHVDTFARKDYFNILNQIRVITIVTPKDCVTAVCVKGLILQRNIPSKQLLTHLKYPNILTFKPAIEAENLLQTNEARFDMMIKNQNATMKSYLQKIYKLQPNVIFVSEHVSKVAFQEFLQNGIMVISKVKIQDLKIIQKLTLIKKRIDHLNLIDKYRSSDVIGVCQKIYFKTVKKGEMLMFIEQQAGIRSVLLGDWNQEINGKLKSGFYQLLKIAWAFKETRQLAFKDTKFIGKEINPAHLVLLDDVDWKKYCLQKNGFMMSLTGTKIVYKNRRFQDLPKAYQSYCLKLGHWNFLELCCDFPNNIKQHEIDDDTFPKFFRLAFYQGCGLMLGTYLLRCLANLSKPCKKCSQFHIERYFIDNYHVTIKPQMNYLGKINHIKFADSDEDDELIEKYNKKQINQHIYDEITNYLQNMKQKILFILYFRCENCGEIINNNKIKLGKDYLSINLLHYLKQIIHIYQVKGLSCFPYESRQKHHSCQHQNIVRIIQCHKAIIKFYVTRSDIYEISPIILNEVISKNMLTKDQRYIAQIYKHQIEEKYVVIEDLQIQIKKMPFSISTSTTFISSASSIPLHQHPYYQHFNKVRNLLQEMASRIAIIEASLSNQIIKPPHDWTKTMRQFYKIQHVLKVILEVINFINHSLKKEKKGQSSSFDQSIVQQLDHYKLKDTQLMENSLTTPRYLNSKFHSSQSMATIISSVRKDTGTAELDEVDDIFKKSRRFRYPQYYGVHLYYPIGNVSDPVSLLACCLNSLQLNQKLKQSNYKDIITCKMNFNKQISTQWEPLQEVHQIYRELFKQDYIKNQSYDYYFSIYYHRQFEQLRQSQGVNFNLYIRSLYGCQNWDSSGGKSNSTFSKSHNQVLVVKIINEKQFVQFQKFALAYLNYMKSKRENKDQSYLAKIYGIYQANIKSKIFKFVVMQNIFLGLTPPLKVYDLKGSQVNRLASPQGDKSYTGLDTNFIMDKDGKPYILDQNIYDKTMKTFEEDAIFLREQSVIDYSLLVIESEKMLRMGIIDFMRPYHFIQKIETIYKEIKSGKNPTVIPPDKYAQRFISSMKKYFIKVPRNE